MNFTMCDLSDVRSFRELMQKLKFIPTPNSNGRFT